MRFGSRFTALSLALLSLLLLAPPAHASAVPVTDGWRYRWGDAPLGAEGVPAWAAEKGDGEGWQPVAALLEPPGRGKNTLLWLSIPIPQGGWNDPALFLGGVANAFEVYANGQRVYTAGKLNPAGREESAGMQGYVVPLPPSVQGGRVLLRIQGTGPAIGVSRDAKVGPRHELLATVVSTGLGSFVMGIVLLAIALLSAAAALLRRQRLLVSLTVFSAGAGMLLIGTSGLFQVLWGMEHAGTRLLLLGSYCMLPGMAWFIVDGVNEGKLRWFRVGAGLVIIPAVIQAVLAVFDLNAAMSLLMPQTYMAVPGMIICVCVASVGAVKGRVDARIFVGGLGFLVGSIVHATLPMLGLMQSNVSLVHWGFLMFTLSLVAIVARRSSLVVQALAMNTRQLEARRQEVRHLADSMGSSAGELATVVEQLRTASEEQTSGISRQASALQQLEQTVQEIRQGSQVTAEKAHHLATAAEGAEHVGHEGGAAIERTLTNLEAIRAEVSEMASRIHALDLRTREVSGIVDTVKALADQSNMLAINAAIEAVRSGDSGKGFGVVAREMRALADQSIQATQRIRDVLDGVSANMRETAKVSEQGEHRIQQSLEAVRTSGSQLQKLAGIIGETSSSVRQITAAVAQQDAGTSQIAQAIQELSSNMQRTLKVVEETQTVTRSVQSLAGKMSEVASMALRSGALDAQPAAR